MIRTLCFTVIAFSIGVSDSSASTKADRADLDRIVSRGITFLESRQAEDGSYSSNVGSAITSLATTALIRHGRSVDDPVVKSGLEYILKNVQPDGGIYQRGSKYRNYETSIAVMCLVEANKDGRYKKVIKRADAFLKQIQWDEGEGKDESDNSYGGGGYGSHERPDLSNTAFLIEALIAAGNDENSEAIQRALIFVSRTQNLESEHNTTEFASKVGDGGFYYTPAAGGTSQAGETDNGGLRSYASMTYAGLKSMIYAGVAKDDPRVTAALKWLGKNYRLDSNPGMGQSGLYYYYHTFAKALHAFGEKTFVDENGVKHDWKSELIAELKRRQADDGSWINGQTRWLEGNPELVTSYALMALSYCR